MSRSLLCLMLLCASTAVAARDIRMQGSNGDGGHCPEIAAAVADAEAKSSKPRTPARTTTRAAKPAKVAPSVRGDSDGGGRSQAPRWHSFLPGMFR